MLPNSGQRANFFPRADATILQSKHLSPAPADRPSVVAPILDFQNVDKALNAWSVDVAESLYPRSDDVWAPAPVPERVDSLDSCAADRYLFPILTRNERLRLTMLFYYTKGAQEDDELMSRLQEKVHLAKETIGWEFVIAGLLDHNTYTRVVTVGLPLAIVPRRETMCAHTVNQPPGTVFTLLNMADDWRFRHSPYVEHDGVQAYAGVPLRFESEFGEHVVFGSLCVASKSEQDRLTIAQQRSLARLADWIVADIVHSARARRQRDRRRMLDLLAKAQKQCDDGENMEDAIPELLREVYPTTTVCIHRTTNGQIVLDGGTVFRPSDLEHGLWEDCDYFDYIIEERNHANIVAPRTVRVIATQCASQRTPTFLVVESKDFRMVFDDVDSWFVHMCATTLCRFWQGRALKEAMAAKENFLRGITHQLRTPIHGILGSVELLTEELKSRNVVPTTARSSPEASPTLDQIDPYVYIKTIQTSARELITTINSLIKLNQWADIAQAERVVALHTISEIETALLNETTIALPDDLSTRPSLIFQHNFPPNLDMLALDLRLFLDSIQPLIVNAAQNSAGGVVAVTISLTEDYEALVVDIEDNGCGIATSDYERIFDAYEKVDMRTTDSGLGLTLACKSATLLNGRIALISSFPCQGSHFQATFADTVCASSFPPVTQLRDTLVQLPSTYYRLSCHTQTTLLGHYFSKYLTHKGYTEATKPDGTFLILDYTPDLAQLYSHLSGMSSSQVAICLVPESAYFLDFRGERIRRQNNVVYLQGPFEPRALDEALQLADSILAEFGSTTLDAGSCAFGGIALDLPSQPPTPYQERLPNLGQHRPSIFPQTLQTELAQSVQNLQIEAIPSPLIRTPTRSDKPLTLLVDDNAINLRLLEMYCSRRGIPYRTATDGLKAVKIFSGNLAPPTAASDPLLRQGVLAQPFELILMDLQMPNCDGIDATQQIRAFEKEKGLNKSVLFIVTGQDSSLDRANADKAGADGYLVKPVGPKILDQWIKHWFPDAKI
ncbi:putative histidine kinase-like protein HHK3p [Plenodomus tracheiphilus IPT5]|uniref:histidine kinase n=1 Tax=Plenodomus tracheiphilus IPT5 TaxID=1408161 RepID=A0A6A7B379_9PLEO|nr:putative histidine kinase-like protein HHK3p [Plenodomus tracheiphilus IPT5]